MVTKTLKSPLIIYGTTYSPQQDLRNMVRTAKNDVVLMTQEMAQKILDHMNFPKQRKIDDSRVYTHRHAIIKCDWIESYPLHFAALPDGRIWNVDGQHRLTAIAQSSHPVPVSIRIIEMDTEQEARNFYAGFDGKASVRTNVQIIDAVGLSESLGLTSRMTRAVYEAAPLLLNNLEPKSGNTKTESLRDAFMQSNKMNAVVEWSKQAAEYDEIIKPASKGLYTYLRKTGPIAVALFTLRYQPVVARQFWSGIAQNDGLRRGDPRNTLIQDVLTRALNAGSVRQRVQQPALAWNAFFEKRDLKIIKCIESAVITLSGTPLDGKNQKSSRA